MATPVRDKLRAIYEAQTPPPAEIRLSRAEYEAYHAELVAVRIPDWLWFKQAKVRPED